MRFLYNRLGWLALMSLASLAQGCISKGDTTINSEGSKGRKPMDEDSGVTSDTGAETASESTEPPATEATDTKPANTGSSAPSASSLSPDVTTAPTEPSTSPSDTSDETTADGAGGAGETQSPPTVPVACTPGATPTRGEVVQLSDSRDFKQGLKLVQGDDGYLLAWQIKSPLALGLGYQAFDADFSPRHAAKKVSDLDNLGSSGFALTWVPSVAQFALAFDQSSSARVTLIDPASGEIEQPQDTGLVTGGMPLFLAQHDGALHVSTLRGGSACQGGSNANYYYSLFFDWETGVSTTLDGPMCQLTELAVFDNPDVGVAVVITPGGPGSLWYVDPAQPTTVSQGLPLDMKLNPSGGAVAGLDSKGAFVMVTQISAGTLLYARLKADGMINQSAEISASGSLRGLAVAGETVGILVEDAAKARLFARSGDNGASVHPVGVVAAQKGLHDSLLATREDQFVVFFLAEDDDGNPQLFGSEILCAAE